MPKKPASPKPDAGQSAGSLERAAEAYDRDIAPASFKEPAPGIEDRGEPEDHMGLIAMDTHSVTREEFDALKARVDALAEVHRQNTGKVI